METNSHTVQDLGSVYVTRVFLSGALTEETVTWMVGDVYHSECVTFHSTALPAAFLPTGEGT